MTPELSRPVAVDRIGADGLDRLVEADAAECLALAQRLALPAVEALSCRFRLTRAPGGIIAARGRLQARVVQTCVVSLEDFAAAIDEDFAVRFVPAGTERDEDPEGGAIDPEAEDEIPYEEGGIDLGEAACEQLALALDPWPRRPDAALSATSADAAPHPFAALAGLRRKPGPGSGSGSGRGGGDA